MARTCQFLARSGRIGANRSARLFVAVAAGVTLAVGAAIVIGATGGPERTSGVDPGSAAAVVEAAAGVDSANALLDGGAFDAAVVEAAAGVDSANALLDGGALDAAVAAALTDASESRSALLDRGAFDAAVPLRWPTCASLVRRCSIEARSTALCRCVDRCVRVSFGAARWSCVRRRCAAALSDVSESRSALLDGAAFDATVAAAVAEVTG